jgi:ankyrin repeat protein
MALFFEAARKGDLEALRKLVECDSVDVNETDPHSGYSAVDYASGAGHLQAVRYLLARGARVEHRISWALSMATWGDYTDVVVELLRAGADPNRMDASGSTPISFCSRGNVPTSTSTSNSNSN